MYRVCSVDFSDGDDDKGDDAGEDELEFHISGTYCVSDPEI